MSKKRKRGAALPRLTVLAYSQRDLLRFTEAVEKLVGAVHDLKLLIDAMPKPRTRTVVPKSSSPQPAQPDLAPHLFS